VRLPEDLDYMMGPVDAGMCKFESLIDGTLDLSHVDLMNDTLRAKSENETRAHEAMRRKMEKK
jgi:hypothetical protein